MEIMSSLTIFAGMLVLVAASGLFVYALTNICRILGFKEYLIVVLFLGFATVLPELFIALNAVSQSAPELAFGNALGTSIASLSFIAGIIAIFSRSFKTNTFFQSKDLVHLTISVVLLIILASDGNLSRVDGVLLLIAFVYYIINILQYKSVLKLKSSEPKHSLLFHLVIIVLCLIAMQLSAQSIVTAGLELSLASALPLFLIATVLIAPLGAVPELIVELELIRSKMSNISFGDLFTSVILNSTLVIGLVAMLSPFTFTFSPIAQFSSLFFVVLLLVFNFFIRSKNELDWKEGLFLLFGYFFYIVSMFIVFGAS